MQTVVLKSGVEVVYNDDETVSFMKDGVRLRSLVITLAHLLALVGAHLEVVVRRKRRTVTRVNLMAANHPLGQFIELIIRLSRARFGETLPPGNPIYFRPGLEIWCGRWLRVAGLQPIACEMRLDDAVCIEQLESLRVPLGEWHNLLMAAAIELLAPMWRRIGAPRDVPKSTLNNPGWDMLALALLHNRFLMWIGWLIITPFAALGDLWRRLRLARETNRYAYELQTAVAALEARVAELQALAVSARATQSDAEAEASIARQAIERDREALQSERRQLDAAALAVNTEVARLRSEHERALLELREQLAERDRANAQLARQVAEEVRQKAELQRLVDNYRESLRELPPES